MEGKEEIDYPPELLPLFKESEDFNPLHKGDECIILSRNPIHWKACIGTIDSQNYFQERKFYNLNFLGIGVKCLCISCFIVFCSWFIQNVCRIILICFLTRLAFKSCYKFPPMMSSTCEQSGVSLSTMSLEKMSRTNYKHGLTCLVNEPESNRHPVLIPRQRLLLARVTSSQVSVKCVLYIYYSR